MGHRKHLREVKALVRDAQLELLIARTNGAQHLECQVRNAAGSTVKVVLPATPSDVRWRKNAASMLRRIAAGKARVCPTRAEDRS